MPGGYECTSQMDNIIDVDVCSNGRALSNRSKCLDMWTSSKAFNLSNLL
jgi:hypothetical protein